MHGFFRRCRIAIDRTREINGLGYSAIRSVEGNQAGSQNFESQAVKL